MTSTSNPVREAHPQPIEAKRPEPVGDLQLLLRGDVHNMLSPGLRLEVVSVDHRVGMPTQLTVRVLR